MSEHMKGPKKSKKPDEEPKTIWPRAVDPGPPTREAEIAMGEKLKAKDTQEQKSEPPTPPKPAFICDPRSSSYGEFPGEKRTKIVDVRFQHPVSGGTFGADYHFKSDKIHITLIDDDYIELRTFAGSDALVMVPLANVVCFTCA